MSLVTTCSYLKRKSFTFRKSSTVQSGNHFWAWLQSLSFCLWVTYFLVLVSDPDLPGLWWTLPAWPDLLGRKLMGSFCCLRSRQYSVSDSVCWAKYQLKESLIKTHLNLVWLVHFEKGYHMGKLTIFWIVIFSPVNVIFLEWSILACLWFPWSLTSVQLKSDAK